MADRDRERRRHRDRDRDRDRDSHRRSRRSRSRSRSRSSSRESDYHRPSRSHGGGGSDLGAGVPSGIPQPVSVAAPNAGMLSAGMMPGMMGGIPPLANAGSAGLLPNLSMMSQAAQAAQDKINRELFVGNTPPGTSELLLMQFLNGAMRRVNLCPPDATPILQCRINQKFAFVELASIDYANKALNLNGIPFLGAILKVARPSKYAGPHVPSQTWQQLTGQSLPAGVSPSIIGDNASAEEKVNRELFVGNTTPEMTESMLRDFLGRAMEQVGLTTMPGNPITACRVSGKFAFVELRSKEEAANALNLNNIPYLGTSLRVGRPSKYTGADTPHGNWEDILAKFMSGELQLNNVAQPAAAPAPMGQSTQAPLAAAVVTQTPTPVVELKHMITQEDLEDDAEYNDILEDTRDECSSFGTLKNIIIPRTGPGATKIFLEYLTAEDAKKAIVGLGGRTFDGRQVEAVFYDEIRFANQDYA